MVVYVKKKSMIVSLSTVVMVNALILLEIFVVIVILDMKEDTAKIKCKNKRLRTVPSDHNDHNL